MIPILQEIYWNLFFVRIIKADASNDQLFSKQNQSNVLQLDTFIV